MKAKASKSQQLQSRKPKQPKSRLSSLEIEHLQHRVEELEFYELEQFDVDHSFIWKLKALLLRMEQHLGPRRVEESVLVHDIRLLIEDVEAYVNAEFTVSVAAGPESVRKH